MTNEEAIEILEANRPDPCYQMLREAVDFAVNALKAQDVTDTNVGNNGDTIYRQDAIDSLYKMLHDYFWADDEELDAIITTLNDLPSAQLEPLKITIDPPTADELERIKHAMRNTPVMLLPSEQPGIIKCRDCKYWREYKYAKETKRYIPFCGFNAIYTKADDFCSRAERRIDE